MIMEFEHDKNLGQALRMARILTIHIGHVNIVPLLCWLFSSLWRVSMATDMHMKTL